MDSAIVAFTTIFALISPISVAAVYAGLTSNNSAAESRSMALRGVLIAGFILLIFALTGTSLLGALGISLAALRTAGGILLLLISIDMVFVKSSGGTTTTDEEAMEANEKQDISVFPLATPLIAGPGAMGAIVLLMAQAHNDWQAKGIIIAALIAVLVLTFICLLLATQLQRVLGVTGIQVIGRILGVLLSALALQFIFDGIKQSGILGT